MKYKVVKISNNLNEYPECTKDTKEYPHLVEDVEDEMELFVVDEKGDATVASDFFYKYSIKEFTRIK